MDIKRFNRTVAFSKIKPGEAFLGNISDCLYIKIDLDSEAYLVHRETGEIVNAINLDSGSTTFFRANDSVVTVEADLFVKR